MLLKEWYCTTNYKLGTYKKSPPLVYLIYRYNSKKIIVSSLLWILKEDMYRKYVINYNDHLTCPLNINFYQIVLKLDIFLKNINASNKIIQSIKIILRWNCKSLFSFSREIRDLTTGKSWPGAHHSQPSLYLWPK